MKKFVRKAKLIGYIFGKGFACQMAETNTFGAAATIGLYQGLKYNGNLVRGLKASGATLVVICAANGARMIFHNIDAIKEA